ncbi:MAG TPA: N-acetylmuramoyl-L-alanine amidase [Rhodocyclaceae bacterium]
MRRLAAIAACLLAAACARLPPSAEGVIQVPSPNFDIRHPNYVIIHQTSDDTADEALATLTNPERKVSAHYLVGRDGALYQLVDENARAWHAGASYWAGDTDMNSASIGIELDNNGAEPFPEPQIERLIQLLTALELRYRIPQANFLAHGDVAPGRKVDPSALFPWERLAAAGFGLWCREPPADIASLTDATLGLRLLGYSVADPVASLAAFRRHFLGIESAAPPDARDLAMLNCLVQQQAGQP